MSDIISARCFGCGNIIKVPAGLGGKKARCPQCTNTISIPMPNDTQLEDIVSDAELPEVAREGEPVLAEEGDAPIPGLEQDQQAEDPSEARRRGSTSVRGRTYASAATNPRVPPRGGTQTRPRPAATKSNSGLMIGIGLGVVALIILAVVVGGNKDHGKTTTGKTGAKEGKEREGTAPKVNTPQFSAEDQALIARLMDYAAAVNRGEPDQILLFYSVDPDEKRRARIKIAQEIVDKKVTYEGVKVTSVGAGTVLFTHNGGSKSITWKQVDGVWYVADLPGN
jgi:hypothetical protein